MEVAVLDQQRSWRVNRGGLNRLLERLVKALPPGDCDSVTLCLVSDRRMAELNRRFRGVTGSTDVLAFPGGRPQPGAPRHLGDVVLSVPTAQRQARRMGHSLSRELAELTVHGYLHLLGHDHDRDDGTMLRLQRSLIKRLLPAKRSRSAAN